jgi:Tfp pilus assembly protein PilN
LTDLRLADSQSGPGLTLDGVVVGGNERAAADVLRAFVRSLESDAAFASVRLGATRAVRVDGEPAQKFTIDASLTSVHAFAFEETQ